MPSAEEKIIARINQFGFLAVSSDNKRVIGEMRRGLKDFRTLRKYPHPYVVIGQSSRDELNSQRAFVGDPLETRPERKYFYRVSFD